MLELRYRAQSLWLDLLDEQLLPRPPLDGDVSCDVAIVGAGFTGLWTAYYLKQLQPDSRVAIVEREVAGFGASGRNGGWVSGGIAGSWSVYGKGRSPDAVLAAEQTTFRAIDEIGIVASSEGIDCGYMKRGMLTIATDEPQALRLRSDLEVARARGLGASDVRESSTIDRDGSLRLPGEQFAVFSPHCARIDPARLVRGLGAACERIGVHLYEGTDAVKVRAGEVHCLQGRVRADHVVLATESYRTQLSGEHRRYLPLYSQMVVTEPLPEAIWLELGWPDGLVVRDRRHLFFYAQRTADGRLAVGGRGAPYWLRRPFDEMAERNEAVWGRLTETVRRVFPPASGAMFTHCWGGPLAVPRDWCMGVEYDNHTGLGWAGGYSGHGVVASHIAGRTMADLILRRQSELVSLPWVGHRSKRWAPEPLRWLASNAIVRVLRSADRYEERTGRTARRVSMLRPLLAPM